MNKYYKINEDVMLNELENQGVVFCQSEVGEKIYYLNDTSMAVVVFLRTNKKTFEEIVNEVLRVFDVTRSECETDIAKLLIELEHYQIINTIIE